MKIHDREDGRDLLDRLREEWRDERPELDTSGMAIVGRTILLGELFKKSAQEALRPFGIGYTDLDVLATLRRSGEPFSLRPATLLKTILLQSGSLTGCLTRLEKAGLVAREPVPEDRRGLLARLTPKGRELVDRAIEVRFDEALQKVLDLSEEDRTILERLLRRLLREELQSSDSVEIGEERELST